VNEEAKTHWGANAPGEKKIFVMHLCKQSSRWIHNLPPAGLLTGSKYAEDVKNRIKILI